VADFGVDRRFEAMMPSVGVAIGRPLATLIGSVANYLAEAVLVGVGLWMCLGDDDDEPAADRLLARPGGWRSGSASPSASTSWPSGSHSA
jgi:hypothetical protein